MSQALGFTCVGGVCFAQFVSEGGREVVFRVVAVECVRLHCPLSLASQLLTHTESHPLGNSSQWDTEGGGVWQQPVGKKDQLCVNTTIEMTRNSMRHCSELSCSQTHRTRKKLILFSDESKFLHHFFHSTTAEGFCYLHAEGFCYLQSIRHYVDSHFSAT